jgi:GNAT superfamily N-acetyltransferase
MRYEQVKLAEAAQHFGRLSAIVEDVRLKQGLRAMDAAAQLERFSRRGDTAALAWDGDQLVGVICLGLCHHFISGPEWLSIKVHLAREGYDLGKIGCTHFVYVSPDYWGSGITSALLERSRRSHPAVSHTLEHSCETPELENWAAALPGMVELALKGPDAKRVFVREVDPAG